jgi:hypothetical protein
VAKTEAVALRGEGTRDVAAAVVGHDFVHRDGALGEPGQRTAQESNSGLFGLVVEDLDVGESAAVVHGDVNELPTSTDLSSPAGRVAPGDAVAGPAEPAQLLDVEVHELSRTPSLITVRRLGRVESAETVQAQARQHRAHGRDRHAQLGRDPRRGHAEPPELFNQRLDGLGGAARHPLRCR